MSKIILGFIGPPGSGKSTQALLLAETLGCEVLNIGHELRSSSNKELEKIMKRGELVPDSFVLAIIKQKVKTLGEDDSLVLDGFFRNQNEVNKLAEMQRELHFQIGAVIDLRLSRQVSIERLIKRARKGENEESIKVRLEVFNTERASVVEVMKSQKLSLIEVDAEPEVDIISSRVLEELKDFIELTGSIDPTDPTERGEV